MLTRRTLLSSAVLLLALSGAAFADGKIKVVASFSKIGRAHV